ncbi:hypothetical protein QAD02_020193 [Eretmocerus hayati]|uniref:Uncharacterized protein n=1 Tax=Eretmocerus hayati TaxID=131215 RepID=A0ACC2PNL3_9HYME|nr:hypothetical protein QAD02_020193 [Eretmocerus hayati]
MHQSLTTWMEQKSKAIEQKLDNCDIRITDLVDRVETLTNTVNDQHDLNISYQTIDDIAKKFDMALPTQTIENFQLLDGKLLDEKLRKIMVEFLLNRITKKTSLTKSMAAILKKFVTRPVLQNYTATKKSRDKQLFCKTQLYSLIEGPMRYMFRDKDGTSMDEALVKKSVGLAINSSTDWVSARKNRHGAQEARTVIMVQNDPGVPLQGELIVQDQGAPQLTDQGVLQFPQGLVQGVAELQPLPFQEVNS